MRRKYICTNGVVEVTQFVVGDKTQATGKRWRKAKTREDKRDENARQAVRVAARILNCNYGPESCLVTLTYADESAEKVLGSADKDRDVEIARRGIAPQGRDVEIATSGLDAPPRNDNSLVQAGQGKPVWTASPSAPRNDSELEETYDRAREVLGKFLEKVRRKAKRLDIAMKTFAVTSDLDAETGELVRVHHHVVVNAEVVGLLEESWKHGHVHTENLYKQDDYTPLAAYLLGQVRHQANRKSYTCSRNMVQPKVEEMVISEDPGNEIRVQPGARVLDRSPYREGTVCQYVRYKRKASTRKRGGHKNCGGGNDVEIARRGIAPQGRDVEIATSGLDAPPRNDNSLVQAGQGKPVWTASATPPRNDRESNAICGGSEFCDKAKGGSV